jgi:hypothetical protein
MKKLVYCAHSGETMKYSEYIFKFVYDMGFIPLDPFLAFPYYMATWVCVKGDKKKCIEDTVDLMMHCDELWVFGENENDFLEKGGVRKEVSEWEKMKGKNKTKYFTWKEVGIPKYVPESNWHD